MAHCESLLHGAGEDDRAWMGTRHIQRLLGSMAVITVMPNGTQDGMDGGYSDWFGLPPGAPAPLRLGLTQQSSFGVVPCPARRGAVGPPR
jgi:hypothetical protein